MEDMPRKLPMHVVKEKTRHGKIVFYFRVDKGPRIRLPGNPGETAFKAAYKAALSGQPVEAAETVEIVRSLRWLVSRYMESGKWAGLSVATRKQQGLFFKSLTEKRGNVDCRAVTAMSIREMLDARKATPFLANNMLKALRSLFAWALENDHVQINPTDGVSKLKAKTEGFEPWSIEDALRFCQRWEIGTTERLAFELLLSTGLRRSDIVRAGKQHMAGNVLRLRTAKTGTPVTVEFSPRVMDVINQTKTGDLAFIVGKGGRPMTKESFGNWFREVCREAGVDKSAHGLRKLSATIAANSGATTHQLMAQYGWVTTDQAEVYTKGADRDRLGRETSRLVGEQIEAALIPHHIPGAGDTQKKKNKTNT